MSHTVLHLFFTAFCQIFLVMLLSPFINTLLKKIKASFQGREGPPWFQGYADLLKYFHKETVISDQASWLFQVTPSIVFSTMLATSLIVPTYASSNTLSFLGGIVLLVYLLGLARFFMACAAMEPGSGFCGMASSREMMLACLIEPVLLLGLFVIATLAGTTNLGAMMNWVALNGEELLSPAYFLAVSALFVASVAEMGRVPFDNPETHYELTMIHEGLLLEYSGKHLGLMFWAAWIKQLLILSILVNLLPPWIRIDSIESLGLAMVLYAAKLVLLCLAVAMVETTIAKVRLFRVTDLLGASFVLAIIALILGIQQTAGGGL